MKKLFMIMMIILPLAGCNTPTTTVERTTSTSTTAQGVATTYTSAPIHQTTVTKTTY